MKKKNIQKSVLMVVKNKMYISCTCGYNGLSVSQKCKRCKKKADHFIEKDNFDKSIVSIKEKTIENHILTTIQIETIERKGITAEIKTHFEFLGFDKNNGEIAYKSATGDEILSYGIGEPVHEKIEPETPSDREMSIWDIGNYYPRFGRFALPEYYMPIDSFEPCNLVNYSQDKNYYFLNQCKSQLIPLFQSWFSLRKIHYIKAEDVIFEENGLEKAFMLLRFPSLQNSPYLNFHGIPSNFHFGLEHASTGDDIWEAFTNHSSKKIKEYGTTPEKFNHLLLYGPWFSRPENLRNFLDSFKNQTQVDFDSDCQLFYFSDRPMPLPNLKKIEKKSERIGEILYQVNQFNFNKGMELITNLHSNETVWSNKLISFVKFKDYNAKDLNDYICDIGKMYFQSQLVIDHDQLYKQKGIAKLHDYLQHSLRKASCVNKTISYANGEKKYEKSIQTYRFELAKDTHQLIDVGELLNICVGSYGSDAVKKICTIVLMYEELKNEPIACIELRNDTIVQAKLAYNERPDLTLSAVIKHWANECGINIRTNDIQNESKSSMMRRVAMENNMLIQELR